jgi:hypothetical protein
MLSLNTWVLSLLLSLLIVVSHRIHLYESGLCLLPFFVTLYNLLG